VDENTPSETTSLVFDYSNKEPDSIFFALEAFNDP
jgi:hypothetical protein